MVRINWDEFKEFKQHSTKNDNFEKLIDFLRSYYNLKTSLDLYDALSNDDTALMMLKKRNINNDEAFTDYMFKYE